VTGPGTRSHGTGSRPTPPPGEISESPGMARALRVTPSHCLDGTIQLASPLPPTGTFTEPSDYRTWIGAVLMGGRKSELIIDCD
jgi:hypothetical protein